MAPQSKRSNIWEKIEITDSCWLWHGCFNSSGYGQCTYEGKDHRVHRLIYQWMIGPIPDGKQLDHLCRVRCCVNPFHLEVVTLKENVLRGIGITAKNAVKTHCINGHKFNNENTYLAKRKRGIQRECKKCRKLQKEKLKTQQLSVIRRSQKWRKNDS